jgi:peroxiredoxin
MRGIAFWAGVLSASVITASSVHAEDAPRSKAPRFKSVDVNGASVSLDDLLGKGPVVVNFWATWCKPCVKELPYLQRMHEEHGARGVQVVAVTIDSPKTQSQVKKFVATRGYTFRVLLDGDQEVFKKMQGRGSIPYVVVLDNEGMFRYQHTGYRPGDEKKLEAVVLGLLGDGAADEAADEADDPESDPLPVGDAATSPAEAEAEG